MLFGQKNADGSGEESDCEGDESWGIPEEQASKQRREFNVRFGQCGDQKELFHKVEPKQLGLWLRGIWDGQKKSIKVVDVRDDDFNLNGHITEALHRPNDDNKPKELIRELKDVDVVVFSSLLSISRGPMCAREYTIEYTRIQQKKLPKQEVYVLTGGIDAFLKAAKTDEQLKSLVVYTKKWVSTTGLVLDDGRELKLDFPHSDGDGQQDVSSTDYWPSRDFFSSVEKEPYFPLDESPRYKII